MSNEPKKPGDDVQGILADLDALLGQPPKPAPIAPLSPSKADSGVELPQIQLAPRDGSLPPAPKKPEPPKAAPPKPRASDAKPPLEIRLDAAAPAANAAPPIPPAPPAALTPPAPPAAAAPAKPRTPPSDLSPAPAPPSPAPSASAAESPADVPLGPVRRVAYVHTPSTIEARAAFAAFLARSSRTMSKIPQVVQEVAVLEVGPTSDPNAVYEKARDEKAVMVVAVTDGWPAAKVDALSAACARGGLLFRAVAPSDVEKRSVAVDVIVDLLLLPPGGT